MTPELRPLSEAELFDWLRLIRSENVGPRTFRGLLDRYRSARAALEALPHLAAKAGRPIRLAPMGDVEAELLAVRRAGLRFIGMGEPSYPPSLRTIDSAPPLLAVKGRLDILQRSMVAIVGSRNASGSGLVMTERLARELGEEGHVVVSGLARGVDARAHLASLATGTVAVLAGGHDRIYPSDHGGLAERIAEQGAVVSEMPFAWEPRGRDFPRRNRIVSGLSFGTVVVEAARRSGSLITARFANEQGREVFAVPGWPLDPRSEGTNDLIKQGATMCTSAADVTEILQPIVGQAPLGLAFKEPGSPAGELYWDEAALEAGSDRIAEHPPAEREIGPGGDERVLDSTAEPQDPQALLAELIGTAPASVDDLVRLSGIPIGTVQSLLVEMELEGTIQRHGDGQISRTSTAG